MASDDQTNVSTQYDPTTGETASAPVPADVPAIAEPEAEPAEVEPAEQQPAGA